MNDADQVFTDLDEHVTLRVLDGRITVELSASGFRQTPGAIANLVVELAGRMPRPGAGSDAALAAGIDAVAGLQQAAATGGFEDFAAVMRGRLGIEAPRQTLSRDPEFDRAVANRLDGVLNSMRAAQTARAAPAREVLTAEAATDEGDVTVASSSERAVAGVWIAPEARGRGLEGLATALTDLIARARDEVGRLAEARAKAGLPDEVAKTIDNAPEDADRAGTATARIVDRIAQANETLQRKAGQA
ncbi:hypothetical protein SAMN05216298_3383 [Glycomyces sambucus]|uniref:Uncharacterized protein n=1 Tax=Glycomyces sambucus TaxID=380244 RepID=A0A1G9J2V2_9ACTN|nr:hypothetical protein [Glycomyces sambucus]SDL31769.1 hypothetical protein SAMN05216298_3383 [Glycomyces sambucus]